MRGMIEVRVRFKTERCYWMMREAILDDVEEGLIEHGWTAEIVDKTNNQQPTDERTA